ncbi:MAG TPA: response regulator [Bacteroidales bacterium]|nr:response regulator [Bacteroidales bacterium]
MENDALHIVLADDDEDDRLFFKEALQEIKVRTRVTLVNDGLQLMNYLNQPGNKLPNVVFLDLNMPKKNGMECLIEIRKNSRLKDLAVAIYSTSSTEEYIEEAFVKGANIYIRKPDDFSELKVILEQVINLNWQYHTSGLKKENFLLNINVKKGDAVPKT